MTCAYAVRVAIMKFQGVESAEVSLNKGLATVKLKRGNSVRPSEFWEAIRKNGNTPKVTRVTVRGDVQADGTQMRVVGSSEIFRLNGSPDLLKTVAGKTVTLEGF